MEEPFVEFVTFFARQSADNDAYDDACDGTDDCIPHVRDCVHFVKAGVTGKEDKIDITHNREMSHDHFDDKADKNKPTVRLANTTIQLLLPKLLVPRDAGSSLLQERVEAMQRKKEERIV